MPSILEVNDLRVNFGTDEAVSGVSFDIDQGETLALVGESGSGKSVTALSILQLLPYPLANHPSGSIKVDQVEVMGADDATLLAIRGGTVSMIFQEPMTSLNPLHKIRKQVSETLIVHKGLRRAQAYERTLELLDLVGLQNAEDRLDAYPHELSGGQRQRVMIAMALANEPRLLIADEPTTALDVTIQAQILKLLEDLQKRMGMAILLITHDLGIVRSVANRVCVMTEGVIVEKGSRDEIFDSPKHRYTQHLLAAEPSGDPIEANDKAPITVKGGGVNVKYELGKGWLWWQKNHLHAVKDIDVVIRAGQTVGIVGESGSGKTTLGLAILRLLTSEGEIIFNSQSLNELNRKQLIALRRDMQIVFQDPYGSLSPRLSVRAIIEEGLKIHQPELSSEERENLVAEVMTEVGLNPDMMQRYPHEFSGGQRQRISIARAMVLRPKFVVLDEPTSALDMSVQAQIVDLLRKLQRDHNLAYLFVSHDLKVVRALANWLIVMKDGNVVEQGPATDVFENPEHDYTKTLFEAALDLKVDESVVRQ